MEETRRQTERITRSLYPYKIPDIKSKLEMNRMDKMMKVTRMAQEKESRHNRMCNNLSGLTKSVSAAADAVKPIKISHTNILSSMDNITKMSRVLGSMKGLQMVEINPSIRAWKLSMERMSHSFTKDYNSFVIDSIKSLTSKMESLNYNKNVQYTTSEDILSIIAKVDEVIENVDIAEFTEELENAIDWQEMEDLANRKIDEIIQGASSEDSIFLHMINTIIGEFTGSNIKEKIISSANISDNLIKVTMLNIAIWLAIFLFQHYLGKAISGNMSDSENIKKIKKELKGLDMYDNLSSRNFRLVTKNELKVRESNKLKSRVKNDISFGRLVKVEYKNKNWTKIIYTDEYIGEIETGWVLTRYIKRLD